MIQHTFLKGALALAIAWPSLGLSQSNCELIQLPDTVEHCTNDPLLLVAHDEPCLSAFSVELDGGNDFVSWNTDGSHFLAQARGSFTWSSWWKMDNNPNNDLQFLWEEGDSDTGWNLYTDNGLMFCGWWQEGDTAMWSVSVLPIGAFDDWEHVAVVGDTAAGTFSVYLNQTLLGATSGYTGIGAHGNTATLGAGGTSLLHTGQTVNTGGGGGGGGGGTPYEWEGWVDEVAYWDVALSTTMLGVAADCPFLVEEGLAAAWMMEPGEDYEALDFSGNGWVGNLQGGELVNDTPDAWPYEYAWSTGDNTPGLSVELGFGGGDTPPGWFFLTVTLSDSVVCTDSTFVTDWNPNVVANVTSPSCFGGDNGAIEATLDGGTAPYTVEINGGNDPMALEAGQYQVFVVDANGCDDQSNVTVPEPEGMFYSFTTTADDCSEANLGSAFLDTLSSPNGEVTIDWNGLALDAMAGGNYAVTATDAAGCVQDLEFTVETDLTNCPSCEGFDLLPDSVWDCFQGPALVVANTLECPNLFAADLDGGNDHIELGTPQGGGPGGGQPGNPLFGDAVVAMTLSVDIWPEELDNKQVIYKEGDEDAGFVVYLDDDSLRAGWWDENSDNPTGVWMATGGVQAEMWQRVGWSCDAANGSMWLGVEGGPMTTTTFTDTLGEHEIGGYIGATQTLRFHDGISFAQGGGGGGPGGGGNQWNHEFDGLVDRFAMWDAAMDFNMWESVSFCPTPTMEASLFAFHNFETDANDISIDEGYGMINGEYASGSDHTEIESTTEDTYVWSNGDTTPYSYLNGDDFGTSYSLFYSSSEVAGCVDTVVVVDWNPQAFVVNVTPPSCVNNEDGSVELALNGGTAPYSWDVFGEANSDSLGVGNYNVMVTDANGCSDFTQFTLDAELLWDVDFEVEPILCPSDLTTQAVATPSGEGGPWSYQWESGSTMATSDTLTPGVHNVDITDANGCTESFDVLVDIGEALLSVDIAAFPPPCVGEGNGMAEANVQGGVAPYTLDWMGMDPMDLLPGAYVVDVVDAEGCALSAEFTIADSAVLELAVNVTDVSCAGESDGLVLVESVGDNGDLTVDWGGAGVDGENVEAGTYVLNVVDALGCTASTEVTVNEPTPLPAGALDGPNVVVSGVGSLYNYTPSGTPGANVVWTVEGGTLATSNNTQAVVFWTNLDGAFLCVHEEDVNGCPGEAVCIEGLSFDGVQETSLALTMFPQPATNMVQLNWNATREVEVQLLNVNGQTLTHQQVHGQGIQLEVGHLPSGMYIVECKHAQGVVRKPLIIKR